MKNEMKNKTLIIVRHGRSQFNVGETKNLDSDLTEYGCSQARSVGRAVAQYVFGDLSCYKLHVSPFKRCLQTARHILEVSNPFAKIIVDPLVCEFLWPNNSTLGINTDVDVPNRQEEFPEFDWSRVAATTSYHAETGEKFIERIHACYDSLDEKSFIVSHGMPCLALAIESVSGLNHVPVWDHSINNCSVSWTARGRRKWFGRMLHSEQETPVPELKL